LGREREERSENASKRRKGKTRTHSTQSIASREPLFTIFALVSGDDLDVVNSLDVSSHVEHPREDCESKKRKREATGVSERDATTTTTARVIRGRRRDMTPRRELTLRTSLPRDGMNEITPHVL